MNTAQTPVTLHLRSSCFHLATTLQPVTSHFQRFWSQGGCSCCIDNLLLLATSVVPDCHTINMGPLVSEQSPTNRPKLSPTEAFVSMLQGGCKLLVVQCSQANAGCSVTGALPMIILHFSSGPHRPLWPVYGEYLFLPPQRWIHSLEVSLIDFMLNSITEQRQLQSRTFSLLHSTARCHVSPYYIAIPQYYISVYNMS